MVIDKYNSYVYSIRMNTTTFTSTINPEALAWATDYAEQTNKTRREVFEEAIDDYRNKQTKILLKEGFMRVAQDIDTIEMAEWGMSDYAKIVK